MQVHIRILESTQENIAALLVGLEYLINISYVDDTEVFKVCCIEMFFLLHISSVMNVCFILYLPYRCLLHSLAIC